MPWRKQESYLATGAAAQIFGLVLLIVGSMVPVGQLVIGVKLADTDWRLFAIVGGFGLALHLFGRALGRRFQADPAKQSGYQAAGETVDRIQEYVGDGGGGDAGD